MLLRHCTLVLSLALLLSACGGPSAATGTATTTPAAVPSGATHGGALVPNGNTHFAIENQSPLAICYVQISATTNQNWGPDRLGATETIPSGASRYWTIQAGYWDFRFLDCNRNTLMERRQVRVENSGVVVTFRHAE